VYPSLPAQSVVPKAPASTKTLTCMSPSWPFDARSYPDFNGPGRTRLVVEKGGVRIPFTGTGEDYFVYTVRAPPRPGRGAHSCSHEATS